MALPSTADIPMTQRLPRTFSWLDGIVIACCLAGALAFWPLLSSHRAAVVTVFRDHDEIAQYPLSMPRFVTLRGNLGPLTLSIAHNSVRVTQSTCPRQLCVHAGAISRNGQQIVCAPNHILIELSMPAGKSIDAVTQ